VTANILDGKTLSQAIFRQLKQSIEQLPASISRPKIVIVQVLGDEASSIYVKHKLKAAQDVGIDAQHLIFSNDISQEALQEAIDQLNQDTFVHGILLQLPLPSQLQAESLLNLINPSKDVDGLTHFNQGCLMQKQPRLLPCTPAGIIRLLKHYAIPLLGQEVVILNASALVGRPLAMLLLAEGATVTLCNSKTRDLQSQVQRADILVSATGKPHVVPSEWLRKGVIAVDVGVHRTANGELIGDLVFETASKQASWITPVPGGVGPMTVAMLMENVWRAYQNHGCEGAGS
jgi:methylenetetrahydrofolate dehydrogenase (NADP+)/methenyltetrahydrofolate cyclohydrolase